MFRFYLGIVVDDFDKNVLELEYFNKYFKFEILEVPTGNVAKERTSELINVLESRGITVDIDGEEDIF